MEITAGEIKIKIDKEDQNFIKEVVPNFLKEAAGLLEDQIQYRRGARKIKLIKLRKDKVENSGLPLQQVPLKLFIPILEKGSLEDNDDLQEKRINMLAKATTDTERVKNSYPEILSQLEGIEVHILEGYYDAIKEKSEEEMGKTHIIKEKVLQIYKISEKQRQIIADNLIRLRLLIMPSSKGGVSIGNSPLSLFTYDYLQLTELGIDFIKSIKF